MKASAVRNDLQGGTDAADGTFTWNGTKWVATGCQLVDTDGDGFALANENFYKETTGGAGTLAHSHCPATATANDEFPDHWPVDLNDDQKATTVDTGQFVAALGSTQQGGPPYTQRLDFNVDYKITTMDVGFYVPVLGNTCPP